MQFSNSDRKQTSNPEQLGQVTRGMVEKPVFWGSFPLTISELTGNTSGRWASLFGVAGSVSATQCPAKLAPGKGFAYEMGDYTTLLWGQKKKMSETLSHLVQMAHLKRQGPFLGLREGAP